MIKVDIYYHNNKLVKMNVSGHANSDDYGKDLICAGVSSIVFGLCNALDQMHISFDYQIDENLISILLKDNSDKAQVILQTGLIQLQTIEEAHKENIQINKQEV